MLFTESLTELVSLHPLQPGHLEKPWNALRDPHSQVAPSHSDGRGRRRDSSLQFHQVRKQRIIKRRQSICSDGNSHSRHRSESGTRSLLATEDNPPPPRPFLGQGGGHDPRPLLLLSGRGPSSRVMHGGDLSFALFYSLGWGVPGARGRALSSARLFFRTRRVRNPLSVNLFGQNEKC